MFRFHALLPVCPSAATLNKISKFFGVTINTLMGYDENGQDAFNLAPISTENEKIINALNKASESDRQIVMLTLQKYFDEKD